MEEFDIREATPEDAEKIIAYLAQVGGETDYLSFGKEGLPISTEEEEKFIQNINKEELLHGEVTLLLTQVAVQCLCIIAVLNQLISMVL